MLTCYSSHAVLQPASTVDLPQGLNVKKLSSFVLPSGMTSPLSDVLVGREGLAGGSGPGSPPEVTTRITTRGAGDAKEGM